MSISSLPLFRTSGLTQSAQLFFPSSSASFHTRLYSYIPCGSYSMHSLLHAFSHSIHVLIQCGTHSMLRPFQHSTLTFIKFSSSHLHFICIPHMLSKTAPSYSKHTPFHACSHSMSPCTPHSIWLLFHANSHSMWLSLHVVLIIIASTSLLNSCFKPNTFSVW